MFLIATETESHEIALFFAVSPPRISYSEPRIASSVFTDRGGPTDRNSLVERYYFLVSETASYLQSRLPLHVDMDDLRSEGTLGLIAAVGRYDTSKEKTFVPYARLRIRGAMQDALRRLDLLPRRDRKRWREAGKVEVALTQKLQRTPTEQELCAELRVGEKAMAKLRDRASLVVLSLDYHETTKEGKDGSAAHEMIADENDSTGRDNLEQDDMRQVIFDHLDALREPHRGILRMYYFKQMNLAQIAEKMKLTQSRICQIHAQALLLLKRTVVIARDS